MLLRLLTLREMVRSPPPLTEDEERQMLERKEAGDEEARNILGRAESPD